jgi:hypothetical protein
MRALSGRLPGSVEGVAGKTGSRPTRKQRRLQVGMMRSAVRQSLASSRCSLASRLERSPTSSTLLGRPRICSGVSFHSPRNERAGRAERRASPALYPRRRLLESVSPGGQAGNWERSLAPRRLPSDTEYPGRLPALLTPGKAGLPIFLGALGGRMGTGLCGVHGRWARAATAEGGAGGRVGVFGRQGCTEFTSLALFLPRRLLPLRFPLCSVGRLAMVTGCLGVSIQTDRRGSPPGGWPLCEWADGGARRLAAGARPRPGW